MAWLMLVRLGLIPINISLIQGTLKMELDAVRLPALSPVMLSKHLSAPLQPLFDSFLLVGLPPLTIQRQRIEEESRVLPGIYHAQVLMSRTATELGAHDTQDLAEFCFPSGVAVTQIVGSARIPDFAVTASGSQAFVFVLTNGEGEVTFGVSLLVPHLLHDPLPEASDSKTSESPWEPLRYQGFQPTHARTGPSVVAKERSANSWLTWWQAKQVDHGAPPIVGKAAGVEDAHCTVPDPPRGDHTLYTMRCYTLLSKTAAFEEQFALLEEIAAAARNSVEVEFVEDVLDMKLSNRIAVVSAKAEPIHMQLRSSAAVVSLISDGQAARSGVIHVGMRVAAVNGESTAGLAFDDLIAKLASTKRPMRLRFQPISRVDLESLDAAGRASVDLPEALGPARLTISHPSPDLLASHTPLVEVLSRPRTPDRHSRSSGESANVSWMLARSCRSISPATLVRVIKLLLMEKQVAFVSTNITLLTASLLACLALISPLKWTATFIPCLPGPMAGFLNAPVPFLVGINSAGFDVLLFKSVTFVMLDEDRVLFSPLDGLVEPLMLGEETLVAAIERPAAELKGAMRDDMADYRLSEMEFAAAEQILQVCQDHVQLCFHDVRGFMIKDVSKGSSSFMEEVFLSAKPPATHEFYRAWASTNFFVGHVG